MRWGPWARAALSLSARLSHSVHLRVTRALLRDLSVADAENVTSFAYSIASGYARPSSQDAGLKPFERRFFEDFAGTTVYVPACGGGREALALAQQGYDVTASEPSRRLRAAAARRLSAPVGRERLQDIVHMRAPSCRFDLVLIGWGAWGHVLDGEARVEILRALRGWVRSEGALCLSWPTDDVDDRWQVTPSGGVISAISAVTMTQEAQRAGWAVVHQAGRGDGYPHAYLVPA